MRRTKRIVILIALWCGREFNLVCFPSMRNSLSGLKQGIPDEAWKTLNIDPQKRAENLTVEEFVNLSNYTS